MTPEQFIECLRREILEDNIAVYEQQLAESAEKARDTQWKAMLEAYQSMNGDQQSAVKFLLRQVLLDTLSNVLGVLDGSCLLKNYREGFSLTYGKSPEKLNGFLQDYFLAAEEDQ